MYRRIAIPSLRNVSNVDDYLALGLTTLLLTSGVAAIVLCLNDKPDNPAVLVFFLIACFFMIYEPFSKIAHWVFYPFSRAMFGQTFGGRGVLRRLAVAESAARNPEAHRGVVHEISVVWQEPEPSVNGNNGKPTFSSDMLKNMERLLDVRMNRVVQASLATCVRCGLCSDACHFSLAMPDDKSMVPVYKAETFRQWYKSRYDWVGKLVPVVVGAEPLSEVLAQEMYDKLWGACTMCRRCTFNCPFGVDYGMLVRTARGIMAEVGAVPRGVQRVVDMRLRTGNAMGISRENFLETIHLVEKTMRAKEACKGFSIPIDRKGAQYLLTLNPPETDRYPATLEAIARVFNAADADFTISSRYWDLTNYGLFTGVDADAKALAQRLADETQRLECEYLVAFECGHGYRVVRWEMPNWLSNLPFKITSAVELLADFVQRGRIELNKSAHNGMRFTYHDSCNNARSGGIIEEPRIVINAAVNDFVEMEHNRLDSFCCSGGGGSLAMPEFSNRRLAGARMKAQEIENTGADIVLHSCRNCSDQLNTIIEHYNLNVKTMNLSQLLAEALRSGHS